MAAILVFAAGVLIPSPAGAQEPRPQGLSPEIEALLRKMLAAYAQADSYRDNGRLNIQQINGRIQQMTRMPNSVTFERPNRVQVTGGGQTVSSDGVQLQIVLDALRQYTQAPAPAKLTMRDLGAGAPGAGVDQGYPEVLSFLLGGEGIFDRWMRHIRTIQMVELPEPKKINDRPVQLVYYETRYKAKLSLYIDLETSLLLRFDTDGTAAQVPAGGPQRDPRIPLPTLRVACQLDPVLVGEEIDMREFAISAPPLMERVERFRDQMAPEGDFAGGGTAPAVHPLLDKKSPPLSELENKVGLVVFWSTKAGPGNLLALALVQRIADHFAKDPDIAILGITTQAEPPGAVDAVMQAKKATFKNITDTGGELLRGFQIAGLPMFYVLDRDGTVRHAVSGAEATVEEEVRSKIEELREKK